MKRVDCEFEADVLSAVLQCRWPDHVDAGLRAHVATCEICADVAAIAGAIDGAREEMRATATVPDSGRVWWVAQLRARREAAETASRPIAAIQWIAFACAAGLLAAYCSATATWLRSALRWVDVSAWLPSATTLLTEHAALVIAMAAVFFLIPAAVYLAIGRD